MDMLKISGTEENEVENQVPGALPVVEYAPLGDRCLVYIDESYTHEFPRLDGGTLSFAALIIAEIHPTSGKSSPLSPTITRCGNRRRLWNQ